MICGLSLEPSNEVSLVLLTEEGSSQGEGILSGVAIFLYFGGLENARFARFRLTVGDLNDRGGDLSDIFWNANFTEVTSASEDASASEDDGASEGSSASDVTDSGEGC
jgi:hypothetical protein